MPRIRSIHPDACDSDKLSQLSDSAERTFFRLLTHTDDDGRGEDRPKLLAAKLYPLHDGKDGSTVNADLDELQDIGLLVRYRVGGKRYYCVPTFKDWQKPRHPTRSKLPSPDEADQEPDATSTADSGNLTALRGKAPAGVGGGGGVGVGACSLLDEPETAPPSDKPKGKAPGKPAHQPLFDALVQACDLDGKLTRSEAGRVGKSAKELVEIGATPDDVAARARAYRSRWPDVEVTPTALVANWSKIDPGKSSGKSVDELLGTRGYA